MGIESSDGLADPVGDGIAYVCDNLADFRARLKATATRWCPTGCWRPCGRERIRPGL